MSTPKPRPAMVTKTTPTKWWQWRCQRPHDIVNSGDDDDANVASLLPSHWHDANASMFAPTNHRRHRIPLCHRPSLHCRHPSLVAPLPSSLLSSLPVTIIIVVIARCAVSPCAVAIVIVVVARRQRCCCRILSRRYPLRRRHHRRHRTALCWRSKVRIHPLPPPSPPPSHRLHLPRRWVSSSAAVVAAAIAIAAVVVAFPPASTGRTHPHPRSALRSTASPLLPSLLSLPQSSRDKWMFVWVRFSNGALLF